MSTEKVTPLVGDGLQAQPASPTTSSVTQAGERGDDPKGSDPEHQASFSSTSPADQTIGNGDKPSRDESKVESQNDEADAEKATPDNKYLVDWDGPEDRENPMNWTAGKKVGNIVALSLLTFTTPLASSMFAPGVGQVLQDFGSDSTLLAGFVVSVYLLGYAFGPLLCAPMSELYGRLIVYQVSTVLFIIFTIACAFAPSLNSLIAFRFLAGSAGAAPLVLGGGTIADCYPREQRGAAMSFFAMGPLFGPVVGPVAGSFLSQDAGWRWVFRLIAILSGLVGLVVFFFMRETYAPVLLERKAARLCKSTGDPNYRSKMASANSPKEELLKALYRPTNMLIRSPTVALFCLWMSVNYGYLYLVFTTITEVYEFQYGWSTGIAGLSFIGLGVGMLLGMVAFGATSDRRIKSLQARGKPAPAEIRLEPLIPAAFLMPIGFFWYGWSADKQLHWIMPLIGLFWIGLGVIGMFMGVQTYLVDCFPRYAASVTSSNTVLRSLVGALLPLAGQPLYQSLGLGWGNSLLAFIAVVCIPLPFIFLKYGERVRTNPRFQFDF